MTDAPTPSTALAPAPVTAHLESDLAFLIRSGPYLLLAKEDGATQLLEHHARVGAQMAPHLFDTESPAIDSVEFFFACALSLGAFTDALAEDLVLKCGWRGLVWGSYLCLLQPPPRAASLLEQATPPEQNQWIVDAARASLRGETPTPFVVAAHRLRDLLAPLSIDATPLRRPPTAREQTIIDSERATVRALYNKQGAQAAHDALATTLAHLFAMPYERWRALPDARRALNTAARV